MSISYNDNNRLSGVYSITSKINDKKYIGSSINIKARWDSHKYELRSGIHNNKYLQNTYRKYGKKNLNFKIIEECEPELLLEREKYWIEYYDTLNPSKGYNLAKIHCTDNFYIQDIPKISLCEDLVKQIKTDLYNDIKPMDIVKKYHVTSNSVYNIKNLNTYKNILNKYNKKLKSMKNKKFEDMDYDEKYQYLRGKLLKGSIKVKIANKYARGNLVKITNDNVDNYIFTCRDCGNPCNYSTSLRNNTKCNNCNHYIKKPERSIQCQNCKRYFEVSSYARNVKYCNECKSKI